MFKISQAALFLLAMAAASIAPGQVAETVNERVERSVSQLKSAEATEQFQAVADLGDLGPLAKPAVGALVDTLKSSNDLALQHEVLITLGRIGSGAAEAVPTIADYLEHESPVLQHEAIHALLQIGPKAKAVLPELRESLTAKSPLIRVSAAWGLAAISETPADRKRAIPVLLEGLKSDDPGILSDAIMGLAEIGEPAVDELTKLLSGADETAAIHAAETLALMGPSAESATGGLIKALDNDSENIAWHAAQALGAIAADPETVVPALAEHLDHPSAMVRTAAATALGNYGNAADAAVEPLAKALSDESVNVRVAAVRALGSIGPDAKAAVPQLNKALEDSAGIVTFTAFQALGAIKGPAVDVLAKRLDEPAYLPLAAAVLGEIGPEAAPATEALIEQLKKSNDPDAKLEILIALASIGPKAEAAIGPLLELAKDGKGRPQRGAIYALVKIGAEKAIPLMKEGVEQKADPLLQRVCAWALVTLEPDNAEYVELALPRLKTGLSDELPLVRKESAIAIRKIGPEAKSAVPALIEALKTSEPEVQVEILDALAQLGPEAKPAIPEAVKLLGSHDPIVRYTAIYLLGQLGEAAGDAAPALEKIFSGQDEFGKAVAAWGLVNIDPTRENKRRAIPLMIRALGHETPAVRLEAAELLGRIGSGNAEVKAALEKAAKDEDESVRQAAEKALEKL